ncbi:MAG: sigma 54-interacting transcriptional regulator, partial [Gammaproteobacteria bacterium]|nr:sigma 54-interacting transcriptional regulator [Gammaproteobacteria bacterium]
DLPPAAQVKLLRVLQSGEVERLGDEKSTKVDVRLVAATNVDLHKAIEEKRFRADLYYRLATYPVEIPPLRERRSDIPLLAEAMVEKYAPVYQKKITGITERALDALMTCEWKGNVRELENVIERGVLLTTDGGYIELEHLFSSETVSSLSGAAIDKQGKVRSQAEETSRQVLDALLDGDFNLQAHEWKLLDRAVTRTNGNLTHAAKLLGISRRQLAYRLKSRETENDV